MLRKSPRRAGQLVVFLFVLLLSWPLQAGAEKVAPFEVVVGNLLPGEGGVAQPASPLHYPLGIDFDADGSSDITSWGVASVASKAWPTIGLMIVKSQARCEIHPNIVSDWSEPKLVEVQDRIEILEIQIPKAVLVVVLRAAAVVVLAVLAVAGEVADLRAIFITGVQFMMRVV